MHVCHYRQAEARQGRAGQDKATERGRPPAAGALRGQSEPTRWHPHTHPHKHVSKNTNPALHPASYRHTTLRTTRYVPTSHLTSRSPLQFAALGVMQQFRSAALVLSGTFSAPSHCALHNEDPTRLRCTTQSFIHPLGTHPQTSPPEWHSLRQVKSAAESSRFPCCRMNGSSLSRGSAQKIESSVGSRCNASQRSRPCLWRGGFK